MKLTQLLDLAGQRAVLGRHVAFDVGEPAVDIAEARPDVARGAIRFLTSPEAAPAIEKSGLEVATEAGA